MRIQPDIQNELVAEYLAARVARDQAQAAYDETSERLIKQMEADQRKSFRWKAGGRSYTLTYVQGHTTVIDEPGLRKKLTAKIFDRYTKRVLDRKAMEAAMDAGEIDPMVVAPYVTQKPHKPHLDYREKAEQTDG